MYETHTHTHTKSFSQTTVSACLTASLAVPLSHTHTHIYTDSLSYLHTDTQIRAHTRTHMRTHTHRGGLSLDLSCSVSLSVVIFIPVLCCQDNSFSTIFLILSDKQLPVTHTHAWTHTHTHSRQNTLMNSPGWIIASANQIPYYSCEFCILSQEDLFCVGGRGSNVAVSSLSFQVCVSYLLPLQPFQSNLIFFLCTFLVRASSCNLQPCRRRLQLRLGHVYLPVQCECSMYIRVFWCAQVCLLPSDTVITSHLSGLCFSAWWHWWQPHKTLYVRAFYLCRSAHHWAIFLFSKEQAVRFSAWPWILKAWLTVTHPLPVLYLSHTCPLSGSAILYRQGSEVKGVQRR